MRITTYYIYLTFFSLVFSSLVSSQSDSCASNLNLKGVIPFETTSLHCHPVWSSEDYTLRYLQTRPNIWSFVLSAPYTNAFVAIGFSTTGRMVGSSAMVGWVPANGVGILKQYFLGATNPAQVVPDQGNLQVVANSTAIVSQSSRLYIAFQLNVTQPESRLLYAVGPRNRIPSSDNRLVQHRDHISTRLDYTSGQLTTERPYTTLRRVHGILNMIGWGIIMIIGAMAARYLKQWDPIWFYSHSSIQLLGFFMGVSGVILGFVVEDSLNASVDRHKTIGMFILILGCLQVIAFLVRPGKEAKVRKYWNWYHYIVGRILIVLAVINIFYGIHVGDEGNGWKIGYGVILAILGIVGVGLEVRKWRKT
ncbi:Cytochrome b561 and domon domain-containing protein [Thalictrum thalictroides]|uniref:Cytochrome b561 and domon domain-containing protein n=1 Tax=Thalictrum thalictroides TaxID=46969 RepID=A0A7J6WQS6_THATH|nr:Cytochrome b561 and domon domain-containing protein [Thalictrum thalictroides]